MIHKKYESDEINSRTKLQNLFTFISVLLGLMFGILGGHIICKICQITSYKRFIIYAICIIIFIAQALYNASELEP